MATPAVKTLSGLDRKTECCLMLKHAWYVFFAGFSPFSLEVVFNGFLNSRLIFFSQKVSFDGLNADGQCRELFGVFGVFC